MLQGLITPPRVRSGDSVAIVSPSFGAMARWPHRAQRGRDYVESLGLHVKEMPHARGTKGWVSGTPRERADDLHAAFLNDDVSVVLAAIGGNHSNQILPLLDYGLIRSHPKIFHGYSDNTVLHWAFLKHAGLRTFYGPAYTVELAEYPRVLEFTDRYLKAAWFEADPLSFEAASTWTDELLDFDTKADLERPRELQPSAGWTILREGRGQGPLVGGCLETICWHLKGSSEWLDLDGTVLFIETSEEAPPPSDVDAYLTDFENMGVFERLAALVVGRPAFYDAKKLQSLHRVLVERTESTGIPVIADIDCGHADPMLTLPLGAEVVVDTNEGTFATTEPVTCGR